MNTRRPHHIWIEQCEAARTIKARFGLKAALSCAVSISMEGIGIAPIFMMPTIAIIRSGRRGSTTRTRVPLAMLRARSALPKPIRQVRNIRIAETPFSPRAFRPPRFDVHGSRKFQARSAISSLQTSNEGRSNWLARDVSLADPTEVAGRGRCARVRGSDRTPRARGHRRRSPRRRPYRT
jgi:hypothetical protein